MDYNSLIYKYVSLSNEYGVNVNVKLDDKNEKKHEIIDHTVIINTSLISENEFEDYLAYDVRRLVLPALIISTKRLILRRFTREDALDCFEFLSDRDTCYNDGGYEPFKQIDDEYNQLMATLANESGRFVIALKESNKVIGVIHLTDKTDRAVKANEIGYIISPNYRKKGYAYEAVSTMVDTLLNRFHLDMIIAGCIESNTASHNLINKLGFSFEGRKTKGFYHPLLGAVDLHYFIKER